MLAGSLPQMAVQVRQTVTAPVRSSSNVPYNRCKVRWNRLVSDEKLLAFCGRIDGLYRGSSYGPGASNCLAQVSGRSALPTVEVPGSFSAVDCVRRVPGPRSRKGIRAELRV